MNNFCELQQFVTHCPFGMDSKAILICILIYYCPWLFALMNATLLHLTYMYIYSFSGDM